MTEELRIEYEVSESEWESFVSQVVIDPPSSVSDQTDFLFYDSLDCDVRLFLDENQIHGLPDESDADFGEIGTTPLLYHAFLFDRFLHDKSYPATLETFDSTFELHLEQESPGRIRVTDPSSGVVVIDEEILLAGLRRFLHNVAGEIQSRASQILKWEPGAFLVDWIE